MYTYRYIYTCVCVYVHIYICIYFLLQPMENFVMECDLHGSYLLHCLFTNFHVIFTHQNVKSRKYTNQTCNQQASLQLN